jgi:hypothetical protein
VIAFLPEIGAQGRTTKQTYVYYAREVFRELKNLGACGRFDRQPAKCRATANCHCRRWQWQLAVKIFSDPETEKALFPCRTRSYRAGNLGTQIGTHCHKPIIEKD